MNRIIEMPASLARAAIHSGRLTPRSVAWTPHHDPNHWCLCTLTRTVFFDWLGSYHDPGKLCETIMLRDVANETERDWMVSMLPETDIMVTVVP